MKALHTYSAIYRIMHWTIAITFGLLLITIFLRLTWMNKTNMAAIIQEYLATTEQVLSKEQAIVLAKKIRQPMWQWHIYLGYILTGLFAIRFTIPLFGHMKLQSPLDASISFKEKFQKWTYILFYICVIISLASGLLIVWGPKVWEKTLESIHVLGIYYLVGFIIIHLAGILIAEFTTDKGIISRIVSGDKKKL